MYYVAAFAAALTMPAFGEEAANFPSKPITIVGLFAPGGLTDTVARIVAKALEEQLGSPVVVENRTGAGGRIGAAYVAKAKPDGYTIMLTGPTAAVNSPLMSAEPLAYDPIKDFRVVSFIAGYDLVLLAPPNKGIADFESFKQKLGAKGVPLNYATAGPGSPIHLAGAILGRSLALNVKEVHYKGGAASRADIINGTLDFSFDGAAAIVGGANAGQVVPIAVTGKNRFSGLSNVPTTYELGLNEFNKYDWTQWTAIVAPVKTPDAIVQKLHDAIAQAANSAGTKARLEELVQNLLVHLSTEEAQERLNAQFEVMEPLLKDLGLYKSQ